MNYQTNNFNNNQGFSNNINYSSNIDYDTELEKRWMGNIYNKVYSKKFSWCATIFGPAYFFYNKMYLTGTLLFIILMLSLYIIVSMMSMSSIIMFVSKILTILFFPITRILCGFLFYPLYKDFVHKKLKKLKQKNTDNSQLLDEASKKGKPSFVSVVISGIYTISFVIYLGMFMFIIPIALVYNIKQKSGI